jgi:hypothetical protein
MMASGIVHLNLAVQSVPGVEQALRPAPSLLTVAIAEGLASVEKLGLGIWTRPIMPSVRRVAGYILSIRTDDVQVSRQHRVW